MIDQSLLQYCPFGPKKILVIGDVFLDHYVMGEVSRISPEAPVPVINVSREYYTAGGAANVALNLASLGAKVDVIGVAGTDPFAAKLHSILENQGINTSKIYAREDTTTIIKSRIIARHQQVCRVDRELSSTNYAYESNPQFRKDLNDSIVQSDGVIVSDYAKGVLNQAVFGEIVKLCALHDKLLAVDPKPSSALNLDISGASVLTPNRKEAFELAGLLDDSSVNKSLLDLAVQRIFEKYSPKILVVTLGAEGMAIAKEGKIVLRLPTVAKEVFDVSGAGDTVIATLAFGMANKLPIEISASIANVAAGVVVSKAGTATVNWGEIRDAIEK